MVAETLPRATAGAVSRDAVAESWSRLDDAHRQMVAELIAFLETQEENREEALLMQDAGYAASIRSAHERIARGDLTGAVRLEEACGGKA